MKEMMTELPKVKRTIYTLFVKRLLDIVLSGTAILLLSPVFLVISVLEIIFHGSPVIFSQERPGLNGKVFKLYKFRSMTNERNDKGELLPAQERLTRFGKVIRKYSIDELPELVCILKGQMSIIGPRPLRVEYLPLYNARYRMRHAVKPGFACVRLVSGGSWTWRDQFENDIWYIENCSFSVDLRMLAAVAKEAIHPSLCRTEATRKPFDGNNYDE